MLPHDPPEESPLFSDSAKRRGTSLEAPNWRSTLTTLGLAIWQKLRWTKANGYVAYTTKIGARSRTRTGMALRPRDFKSLA
ncbi:MAG: hypothetical protein QOI59_5590, partial [Gammaproteobacteria bacterium]|nr:hypothetical protein [Gammaproteobacteria bacterium]